MSNLNTGPIDTNYPVPGVVNTTEQFRKNWSSIKQNLDTTAAEITELQNKVLLKGPVPNVVLDNNMAGTLLSNTLQSGFRHTTKNLGNDINGTINIDVSVADVQYMTVTGQTQLNFTGWPSVTGNQQAVQSNVQVILNEADNISGTSIYLPPTVSLGTTTIENYNGSGQGGFFTFPANVKTLHFNFTSTTTGATIEIEPINRPRRRANAGNSTVTQVNFQASGFSVSTPTISTSGSVTVQNLGVTSVAAGSNITVSSGTGAVTVTNITSLSRIPLGVPNPVGVPGDIPGSVRADSGFLYVCTGTFNGYTPIWKRANLAGY
jgi:hypothetical protein